MGNSRGGVGELGCTMFKNMASIAYFYCIYRRPTVDSLPEQGT